MTAASPPSSEERREAIASSAERRSAQEVVAQAVYGYPEKGWLSLTETTRQHHRRVADCVLRELKQAGYALSAPDARVEGLRAAAQEARNSLHALRVGGCRVDITATVERLDAALAASGLEGERS